MTRFIRLSFVLLGAGMIIFVAVSRFRAAEMPTERMAGTDDAAPREEYSLQAVLKGSSNDLSVGLATQRAIGGDFIVLIDAQLNPPPAGSVYYGWLVRRFPEFKVVPLGRLTRASEASNLWKVAFRAASSLAEYGEVWVTREPEYADGDEPGAVVLKGEWE